MIRFLLFILVGLLCNDLSIAQDFEVRSIEVNSNSGSKINEKHLALDKDGFKWYTTYRGLVKYYGKTQETFSVETDDAPNNFKFNFILQDNRGRILSATSKGLFILDYNNGIRKWHLLQYPNTNAYISINKLTHDGLGNIWMSCDSPMLLKFNTQTDSVSTYKLPGFKDQIGYNNKPTKILKTFSDGSIWVLNSGEVYEVKDEKIKLLYDAKPWRNRRRPNRGLFVISLKLDDESKKPTSYRFLDNNYKMAHLNDSYFLLESPNSNWQSVTNANINWRAKEGSGKILGFNTLKSGTMEIYQFYSNRSNNTIRVTHNVNFNQEINSVIFDETSALWVSTATDIYKVRRHNREFKSVLSREEFNSNLSISAREMVRDTAGNMFVGNYSKLIKVYANGDIKYFDIEDPIFPDKKNKTFRGLYLQNDSTLWSVGERQYLDRINLSTSKAEAYIDKDFNNVENLSYYKVIRLNEDQLLLGSSHGLSTFNINDLSFSDYTFKDYESKIDNALISDLLISDSKILWVATKSDGIFRHNLNDGSTRHLSVDDSLRLNSNIIFDINFDSENSDILYIGSNKGFSILNYSEQSIEHFGIDDGLQNSNIVSILSTDKHVWLGTYDGLIKYIKRNNKFLEYNTEDGLPDAEFNQQSSLKFNDSLFYFGGLNGLVKFNPYRLRKIPNKANISLVELDFYDKVTDSLYKLREGFEIENIKVEDSTELTDKITEAYKIELSHKKNDFRAVFAINGLYSPEKSTFLYKYLNDDNNQWTNQGTDNILDIYNLKSGTNKFLIKGFDTDRNESRNQILLIIDVDTVFYKTWWFIGLNVLALFSFIAWRDWARRMKQKRLEEQRIRRLKLEAKALRAQMNPHFISNALNGLQSVMILKGEQEANRYMSTFSRLLRSTIDMAHTETISLADEITYLSSYLDLETYRQPKLNYEFIIDPKIDKEKILIPCFIFQPIVENSLIHGLLPKKDGHHKVVIEFVKKGKSLYGCVTDNGIGRKASAELKAANKFKKKSWSTTILKERIDIINYLSNRQLRFEIEDLYEDNKASGTRTQVTIELDA